MKIFNKKTGFTIVETLIFIAVFALAMAAVFSFTITIYRSQRYTWHQAVAVNEARKGIETMVKELREAKEGDNGSYAIEKAADKEIIFYSDIDQDSQTERVRYFLGAISPGSQTQTCATTVRGGSCSVTFSNFYTGSLISAQLKIEVEGDLGAGNEYAEIFADGQKLNDFCRSGCTDCAASWQGTEIYDVMSQAGDNFIQLVADATYRVDPICDWQEPNHSFMARFELTWTEENTGDDHELKKGVIEPTSPPVEYPPEQEKVTVLSSYVRNAPPIFEYFDQNGNKITYYPARLVDTKLIKVFLAVDAEPERDPPPYELESAVRLRNFKTE